jgi:Recombinational DNA repair protein (RecF pathway)
MTRFLDLLDATRMHADRPTLDPLGLAFQLKLLWLAGYLPHVTACSECGAEREPLVGYSPRAGGAVCQRCAPATEALALAAEGVAGIEALLARPLADASQLGLSERAQRDVLRVITTSYEYHGGFRAANAERLNVSFFRGSNLSVPRSHTLVGGRIGTSTVPPPVAVTSSMCARGWHGPF